MPSSDLPDDQLLASPGGCRPTIARAVLRAYVGDRANRRHKPGRAFERTHYRFDVLADYGAFRDLQRHRLLTLEWQPLSTAPRLRRAGGDRGSRRAGRLARRDGALGRAARRARRRTASRDAAAYAVVMAYRVRFYMDMNAREAMHVIELRTAPQGHPSYRRVCQAMHRRSPRSPAIAPSPPRCSSPITRKSSWSGCSRNGRSRRSARSSTSHLEDRSD